MQANFVISLVCSLGVQRDTVRYPGVAGGRVIVPMKACALDIIT